MHPISHGNWTECVCGFDKPPPLQIKACPDISDWMVADWSTGTLSLSLSLMPSGLCKIIQDFCQVTRVAEVSTKSMYILPTMSEERLLWYYVLAHLPAPPYPLIPCSATLLITLHACKHTQHFKKVINIASSMSVYIPLLFRVCTMQMSKCQVTLQAKHQKHQRA